MILIRGGVLDCKDMNESMPSVVVGVRSGQPSTAAVASVVAGVKPTIKPVQNSVASSIGRNNNKTGVSLINSKSQSPSEDKTIRYGGLPCETDHMYANYTTTDSGKYRELANEVAHLKALVLFHLDLIQQQSESNAAKDKQLSVLKQENEMLRQRLDRMERRVQLQNLKQKPDGMPEENVSPLKVIDVTPIQSSSNHAAVSSNQQGEIVLLRVPLNSTPVTATIEDVTTPNPSALATPIPEMVVKSEVVVDGGVPKKRIKTLLPVRRAQSPPVVRPTTPDSVKPKKRRKLNKSTEETTEESTAASFNCESDAILDDLINQAVKEGAIINVTDGSVAGDNIVAAKVVLEPCPPAASTVVVMTSEVVENNKQEPVKPEPKSPKKEEDSILPEHKRIQQLLAQKAVVKEPNYLKKDLILTTETPYWTHVGECGPNQAELIQIQSQEAQVEVPRWVVKPLVGRPSTLGTPTKESLDDAVFNKRHLKHEMDEKRRKRWDLQRIREQRQYEKLRARYEGEDRSQDRMRSQAIPNRSPASVDQPGGVSGVITSLWASTEDVAHIQIEPWLPVSVFGGPLPNIPRSDFQLPWSNSRSSELLLRSKKDPTESITPTTTTVKRRYQRRSQKTE